MADFSYIVFHRDKVVLKVYAKFIPKVASNSDATQLIYLFSKVPLYTGREVTHWMFPEHCFTTSIVCPLISVNNWLFQRPSHFSSENICVYLIFFQLAGMCVCHSIRAQSTKAQVTFSTCFRSVPVFEMCKAVT